MPLRKLWNTLRGHSSESSQPEKSASVATSQPQAPSPAPQADPSTRAAVSAKVVGPVAGKPVPKATTAGKKKSKLSLFGAGSPHAPLLKLLRKESVSTVLEIGVDDGSRVVEVYDLLSANTKTSLRYVVVDQFEMAGGETTLQEFHRTTRGAGVKVQVFPESVTEGITRVAHTIGTVDLILFSTPASEWANDKVLGLLARISTPTTAIFIRNEDRWSKTDVSELAGQTIRRAA